MSQAMIRTLVFSLALALCGQFLSPVASGQEAAQETLPQSELVIVSGDVRHAFTVELADEPDEIRTGMMFRESMADDAGMLFQMDPPRGVSFWMKNTLLPLDLLFIDTDGEILAIAENAVPGSLRQIDPGVIVAGVLELNAGTVERLSLAPGDLVEHEIFTADDAG